MIRDPARRNDLGPQASAGLERSAGSGQPCLIEAPEQGPGGPGFLTDGRPIFPEARNSSQPVAAAAAWRAGLFLLDLAWAVREDNYTSAYSQRLVLDEAGVSVVSATILNDDRKPKDFGTYLAKVTNDISTFRYGTTDGVVVGGPPIFVFDGKGFVVDADAPRIRPGGDLFIDAKEPPTATLAPFPEPQLAGWDCADAPAFDQDISDEQFAACISSTRDEVVPDCSGSEYVEE